METNDCNANMFYITSNIWLIGAIIVEQPLMKIMMFLMTFFLFIAYVIIKNQGYKGYIDKKFMSRRR